MDEKRYKVRALTFDGDGELLRVDFGVGSDVYVELTKSEILNFARCEEESDE